MAPTLRARLLAELARREKMRRAALADFGEYVRQAIAAGQVPGVTKLIGGRHVDAFCLHTQLQLEGWLVAYGYGTPEMVARQREQWEREWPVERTEDQIAAGAPQRYERARWEDGLPEPWLRYVLVQNHIDNLPPGTLKSTIGMVLANTWIWLHAPRFIWGAASGIDANVTRDSNATRDIVKGDWYRSLFAVTWLTYDVVVDDDGAETTVPVRGEGVAVRPDADAVSDWATTAGGRRYSRTMQRGFTGLHVDGSFIDDPDDAYKVWNETARVATQNKFTTAMENRVNDEHRSIRKVMQQKVHTQDFSAYLLSMARWSPANPKGWARLCIAAEFGFGPADVPAMTPYGWVDWRTYRGELMHSRLSAGVLADKRLKMPGYEGQYNQNPDAMTLGMFERRFARFFVFEGENVAVLRRRPLGCPARDEQPPVVIKLSELRDITLSVDAANSLNPLPGAKVSAVGLIVAGCRGEERYGLDDRTRVLGVSGTYRAIFQILRDWPIDRVLVELKALGAGVVDELQRAIRRGWYLDPDTDERIDLVGPDGRPVRCAVELAQPGQEDKVQRANAMLPPWQQGLIFFHDGAGWLYPQVDDQRKTLDEGAIGEVCSFPASRRKDRVDSWSQFVTRYRGSQDGRERIAAARRLGLVVAHMRG